MKDFLQIGDDFYAKLFESPLGPRTISLPKDVLRRVISNGKVQQDFSDYEVFGDLDCSFMGLKTLENFPRAITGTFNIDGNQIESLKGAPLRAKTFFCTDNPIDSLEALNDGQHRCYNHLNISNTRIQNLKGLENVDIKVLSIGNNNFLKSYEGIGKVEDFRNQFGMSVQANFLKVNNFEYTDYWKDLLNHCLKFKSDSKRLIQLVEWPEGFLDENLNKSVNSCSKYNL